MNVDILKERRNKMSYYINIDFYPNISPINLLPSIQKICSEYDKQFPEIVRKNIEACSVHPFNVEGESFKDLSRKLVYRTCIENFVEHLTQHTFLYYPEYNLLGAVTKKAFSAPQDAIRIQFQNSCDQDYSLNTWDGVPIFEEIRDEILGKYPKDSNSDTYGIRTKIYTKIEETLEIDKYIFWLNDFHFQSFTVSFLNERQKYQHYDLCRKLLNDAWKEWEQ